MHWKAKRTLGGAAFLLAAVPALVWAQDAEPLQQRVERIERIIQGQGLMNLITRVDQLQNEVQRLNGDNEVLRHQLEQMQQRQREMYLDLDQRLQQAGTVPATADAARASSTDAAGGADRGDQDEQAIVDPASPDLVPSQASGPAAVENGEAAYQAALQSLRSGQYEQAAAALAAFPMEYPGSIYEPNAYYWQGEAKYVMRQFAEAAALFQIVIDQYPDSDKVADALLKRGFSEDEMGDSSRAAATLQAVVDQYPDTSAARLARVRLDRINQQTR